MPERREAVIISAVRTPTGKFMGALKDFKATELGALVVREAVRRAQVLPEDVDEVIMGCVIQAGLGRTRRGRRRCTAASPSASRPSPSTRSAARASSP
jgi:acetyl-CoA C-acetyltransferase